MLIRSQCTTLILALISVLVWAVCLLMLVSVLYVRPVTPISIEGQLLGSRNARFAYSTPNGFFIDFHHLEANKCALLEMLEGKEIVMLNRPLFRELSQDEATTQTGKSMIRKNSLDGRTSLVPNSVHEYGDEGQTIVVYSMGWGSDVHVFYRFKQ